MMFDSYLHRQCSTLADCFVLSGKDKWCTTDFTDKLFHTDWGINILKGISINEYTCGGFMYEGLVNYNKKVEGNVYPEKILWYCGYLYRYLFANSKHSPAEIYKNAPLQLIEKRYGFYHTQDWDYVMEDLNL